ncbi:hypothetical protein HK405_012424, partial [Cladochytrium tenue]
MDLKRSNDEKENQILDLKTKIKKNNGAYPEDDNFDELYEKSVTGWPVDKYPYDFFISYRVSSERQLAKELYLRLQSMDYPDIKEENTTNT